MLDRIRGESSITRDLITLAAGVIVVIGMKMMASIIVPVFFAAFIVLAFLPMLRWLERKGVGKLWSLIIVIATVVVGLVLIGLLIVVAVAQVASQIPTSSVELDTRLNQVASDLSSVGITVTGEQLAQIVSLQAIVKVVVAFLPPVTSAIGALIMAIIIFVYALIDVDNTHRRLLRGIGADDPQIARVGEMVTSVSDYIRIRALLGGAAAILDFILLLLLDVKFALLWAFVSFVMSFVPYIGYWVALIPPLILAWTEHGLWSAVIVFFGYWAINGAIDNFVGPKMLGQGLNIAPTLTVISLLFWGFVLGPVGAILAMPLTVGFKTLLLSRSSDSRWLALLISAGDGSPKHPTEAVEPGVP